MAELKRKHSTPPIRVFKRKLFARILPSILMVLFGGLASGLATSLNEFPLNRSPMMLALAVFYIGFSIKITMMCFMELSLQTEVYENGLKVQQNRNFDFTTWDNLSHFKVYRKGRHSIVVGIMTYDPVERHISGGWFERILYNKSDMRFMEVDSVFLPTKFTKERYLKVDEAKLVDTEFGQYLQEYAPHLFSNSKGK